MLTCRGLTIAFIVVWIVVAILYDIIVLWQCGVGATISRVIYDWALGNPIVALAIGILCGHFFWSQK